MILDKNNTLGYSVIEGRLKIFVKKGVVSQSQNTNQSQESSNQNQSKRIIKTLYAMTPVNNLFEKFKDDTSDNRYIYKLDIFEDSTGEVDLIPDSQKAKLSYEDYMKPACKIVNEMQFREKPFNRYITVKKGKIISEGNNYKLIEKIEIKFE